jgi:hypothetical protein
MACDYLLAALFGAWENCRWHRVFVRVLRFSPFNIIQNSLIKNNSKIQIVQVLY